MTFMKNRSISVKTKLLITVLSTGLLAGCSLSFDQMLPALTGTESGEITSPANEPVNTKPVPTVPVQTVKTIKPSQPPQWEHLSLSQKV